MSTLRNQLVYQLNKNIAHWRNRLNKFAEGVKGDNPRHTLVWETQQAISDASYQSVYTYYLEWIGQEGVSLVLVRDQLQERANRLGINIPSSTSVISNMVDNYERVAIIDLINDLKSHVARDDVLDREKQA